MANSNLKSFVKLDFLTARPGYSIGAMIFYVGLIITMTLILRSVVQTVWLLMFFLNSFISLPFSLGERHNMDALYINLNVNRKTVVMGRYIYAMIIWACGVFLTFAIAGISLLLEHILDINIDAEISIWIAVALSIMLILTQAMQLPIYFKFSHTKSNLYTMIPYIGLMLGSMLLMTFMRGEEFVENLVEVLASPSQWGLVLAVVVVVVCAFVYGSYRLALKFYSTREF